ncbi:MAG TPA: hypothetical protein PLC80_01300 [Draconibacterium sp.]|nr:hypothetical protein [Draconibacterium sp.]
MNEKLHKISPEFLQFYSNSLREMWMNLFHETIKNLLVALVNKYIDVPVKNEVETLNKETALKTLNELMPLVPLLGALKNFGIPKSLLFISENGQAIDLLEVKQLDENQIFNQVLDNLDSTKTKEKQNIN